MRMSWRMLSALGKPVWAPWLAFLLLVVASYRDLAAFVWQTDEMAYAPWLALVALGLFVHHGRSLVLVAVRGFPLLGSVLLLLGGLAYILGRSQHLELIELAALIPLAAGVLAVLGGWPAVRHMAFPLFFLLFSLPYPGWVIDALTQPLKLLISQGSEVLLYHLGYPIARNGVLISLGQYRLLVADACSGLHSLIFLSALGLLYVRFTGPRPMWQQGLLIAALVPIAILANFFRVLILLLVTYHFGNAMGQSYWHDVAGLVLFAIAFATLYGLDSLLRLCGRASSPASQCDAVMPPEGKVAGPGWARCAGVATLLLAALGLASGLTPQQHRAAAVESFSLDTLVPKTLGDWVVDPGVEIAVVSPEITADLNRLYSQSLERTYINTHGERVMLSIAYGGHQLGNALQAHRPEYCYRAQGFTVFGMVERELELPGQSLPVRQLLTRMDQRMEPVTYWMTVGDQLALPGLSRKLAQVKYGLQGQIPDGMLIRVSSLDRDPGRAFALQQQFITDLQQALPGQLGFVRSAGLTP